MKKITYILACACMMGLTSCADTFLDLEPLDSRTDAVYFKKPEHFREFANGFYGQLLGWRSGIMEHMDLQSDLVNSRNGNQAYLGYGTLTLGYDDARWDHYNNIRTCNILLQRGEAYSGNQSEIDPYLGEAYFFRAYNYFYLLKYFGGVPIITVPLDTDSPELQKPRNSRYEVADLILSDLQNAISRLPKEQNIATSDKGHISEQGAKAFKARVLLYEATWRKYNKTSTDYEGSAGPKSDQVNEFLEESISLSKDVLDDEVFIIWNHNNELDNLSSRYLFCLEDGSQTGGYGKDSNKEFIIYSVFDRVLNAGAFSLNNEMNYIYPTRKFIDMFVCTNGMPTTNNEQFKGYQNVTDEYQNRDYRLMAYVGGPAESIGSTSGYGDQKFRNPIVGDKKESANYPVLRLAEVCLNYAEAIMERYGEITDAQLGISINKLRDRAGVAHLTNALVEKIKKQLNSEKELSEIMLDEIRRERTVELYMEGFRYDDLKRWGILEETLNQSRLGRVVGEAGYSTPFKDASGNPTSKYDAKSYVYGEETVITGDGKEHACVVISPKANSTVRKAHYLWPIPQHQINLNPNLKQNPGY